MGCESMAAVCYVRTFILAALATLLAAANGCGTAAKDEPGRCKVVKNSNYNAGTNDTDGKPWVLSVFPEAVSLRCNSSTERGQFVISSVIRDSLGAAKAGLVIRPNLSGAGTGTNASIALNAEATDLSTDACGVAYFTVDWRCPATNKEIAATLFAMSGALTSKDVKITIANVVLDNITTSNGTPTPVPSVVATPPR